MPDPSPIVDAALVIDPQTQRLAYERMRPKFLAIPEHEVMRVNVDAQNAVGIGLLVAGRIPSMRADFERLAYYLDLELIDELRDRALAFGYAHSDYLFAIAPQQPIADLRAAVAELTNLLLISATALSQQGLLPNERVERVRSSSGYKDASEQLMALVKLFQDYWPTISNKTGITQEQVDKGAVLALELLHGATLREHTKLSPTEATLQRERAFTLFYRAYIEVRRGVDFVRFHQRDSESVVPTLFPRGSRKREDEVVEGDAPVVDPVPVNGDAPVALPSAPTEPVPVGHRGRTPFAPTPS